MKLCDGFLKCGVRFVGLALAACAVTEGVAQEADAGPTGDELSASPVAEIAAPGFDLSGMSVQQRRAFFRSQRPAVSYFVEGGARWSLGAEPDGTDAEIGVSRLNGAGGLSFRLDDTTDLIVRLGSEVSVYDFQDAGGILPAMPAVDEPFDVVHATTFTPILRSLPETGWQWTLGGRVTVAGEPGAAFDESIAAGGFGLASYDVSERLRLGAGLNVVTRLEGGLFLFPIPVVQWDVTDHFQIGTTERGFGATYALDDRWTLGVQVGFLRREFRLADDNAISEGSFTDWRVPVTLSATYAPSARTVFTARLGSEVIGELEFNDRDGNQIENYDLSPTLLVGLDVRILF